MPNVWSYEQLLQLAPDATTLERSRRLFFSKGWDYLQGNGQWLWGAYSTQYGNTSKAAVRLDPPLFRCSCKSRKKPCHHSLALVLLFLNRQEAWIVKDELPDWVQAFEKQIEPPKPPTNNTKVQQERILLMDQGVEELEKWLNNVSEQGLAQFTDPEVWEYMAARMVDTKLGSIGNRLRRCKVLIEQDDWLTTVGQEIGGLYLFVKTWQRKTSLSSAQKKSLLLTAGWNFKKDNVRQNEGIADQWLVIGLTTGVEDKLTYRRTWLLGEKTQRLALILDFAYGNQNFDTHWLLGSVLKGELAFYEQDTYYRAVFKHFQSSREAYDLQTGFESLEALGTAYAQELAKYPWLMAFPVLLTEFKLTYNQKEEQFYFWDHQNKAITVANDAKAWQLLALSTGHAVDVFGEYDGRFFNPLTLIDQGRLIEL